MTDNRIFVISHIGCGAPSLGNRTRMRMLLHEIRRLGFVIHFAGISMSDEEREATLPYIDKWVTNFSSAKPGLKTRVVRKLSRLLTGAKSTDWNSCMTIDQLFDSEWTRQAKEIQRSAHYERIMVAYVFHSAFLCCFPETCLKLIDTHDVFAGRSERLAAGGAANFWFSTTQKEERKGLMRADRILAIQAHEASFFRQLTDNERPVFTVGHFTEPRWLPAPVGPVPIIGILASDNPLNVSGVDWFFQFVWPQVLAGNPEAILRMGGRICAVRKGMPSVESLGEVKDVVDFYVQCSFTINPMQTGTGLKIKSVESLSFGRPLVATSVAAEGLESCVGKGLLVTDDAGQFAQLIGQLLRSPGEVERLGHAAINALEQFNREARDNLVKALAENR